MIIKKTNLKNKYYAKYIVCIVIIISSLSINILVKVMSMDLAFGEEEGQTCALSLRPVSLMTVDCRRQPQTAADCLRPPPQTAAYRGRPS